jgi:predicted lipoprotein with Yx(FWY)xxD motif
MKRLLILGALVVAAMIAAVAFAATGGGGDDEPAPAAPSASGALVSTEEIDDAGEVVVDSEGRALYAADQETSAGMVLCADGCTSFWEPLTVSGGAPTADGVSGELGVVERPDGARQVTLAGKLLYTFVEDAPGEVTGDGFEDAFDGQTLTWRVVHADGGTSSSEGGETPGPFGY